MTASTSWPCPTSWTTSACSKRCHTGAGHKKARPEGLAFFIAGRSQDNALPLWGQCAHEARVAWVPLPDQLLTRLRYSFVRVSISILSPMAQNSGTFNS